MWEDDRDGYFTNGSGREEEPSTPVDTSWKKTFWATLAQRYPKAFCDALESLVCYGEQEVKVFPVTKMHGYKEAMCAWNNSGVFPLPPPAVDKVGVWEKKVKEDPTCPLSKKMYLRFCKEAGVDPDPSLV